MNLGEQTIKLERLFGELYATFNAKKVPWGAETYAIYVINPDFTKIKAYNAVLRDGKNNYTLVYTKAFIY